MGFGDALASTGPYTPCPEKNETNNILGITLTKFNKFSQLLAQFWYIFQQDSAPAHRAWATVEFLERETPRFISPLLWPLNSPDLNPVDYSVEHPAREGVQNMHHWSRRPQTSHQNWVGQAGSCRHCCSCASVASTFFSLCKAGGGHFEHCF